MSSRFDEEQSKTLTRLAEKLIYNGEKVTCAESCTGGLVAAAFTSLSGSSAWFDAGFVTYSNEMKHVLLGVEAPLMIEHGVVSEPVVIAMAEGALDKVSANYSVALSGVAGPGGGSVEKPVGTVCFGFASSHFPAFAITQCFAGDRHQVRESAVSFALERLLAEVLKH